MYCASNFNRHFIHFLYCGGLLFDIHHSFGHFSIRKYIYQCQQFDIFVTYITPAINFCALQLFLRRTMSYIIGFVSEKKFAHRSQPGFPLHPSCPRYTICIGFVVFCCGRELVILFTKLDTTMCIFGFKRYHKYIFWIWIASILMEQTFGNAYCDEKNRLHQSSLYVLNPNGHFPWLNWIIP